MKPQTSAAPARTWVLAEAAPTFCRPSTASDILRCRFVGHHRSGLCFGAPDKAPKWRLKPAIDDDREHKEQTPGDCDAQHGRHIGALLHHIPEYEAMQHIDAITRLAKHKHDWRFDQNR